MMSLLLTVVVCSLQDEVVSCSRLSAGVDCMRLHRAHQFSYATNIHGCSAEKEVGGRLKQDLHKDLQLHRILILLY